MTYLIWKQNTIPNAERLWGKKADWLSPINSTLSVSSTEISRSPGWSCHVIIFVCTEERAGWFIPVFNDESIDKSTVSSTFTETTSDFRRGEITSIVHLNLNRVIWISIDKGHFFLYLYNLYLRWLGADCCEVLYLPSGQMICMDTLSTHRSSAIGKIHYLRTDLFTAQLHGTYHRIVGATYMFILNMFFVLFGWVIFFFEIFFCSKRFTLRGHLRKVVQRIRGRMRLRPYLPKLI